MILGSLFNFFTGLKWKNVVYICLNIYFCILSSVPSPCICAPGCQLEWRLSSWGGCTPSYWNSLHCSVLSLLLSFTSEEIRRTWVSSPAESAASHRKPSRTVVILLGVALKLVPLLLMKFSLPLISSYNLPLLSCTHKQEDHCKMKSFSCSPQKIWLMDSFLSNLIPYT